ncbi:hypothetical protein A6411_14260 [Prescottella equi]|nr:hypothetical protein A6411_14260 [Prescottella equi]
MHTARLGDALDGQLRVRRHGQLVDDRPKHEVTLAWAAATRLGTGNRHARMLPRDRMQRNVALH